MSGEQEVGSYTSILYKSMYEKTISRQGMDEPPRVCQQGESQNVFGG